MADFLNSPPPKLIRQMYRILKGSMYEIILNFSFSSNINEKNSKTIYIHVYLYLYVFWGEFGLFFFILIEFQVSGKNHVSFRTLGARDIIYITIQKIFKLHI